jgi:hypothetical protein
MPGPLLTTTSTIKCPHGGTAVLLTANTTTSAGARVLLESDMHDVFGCTFTVGTKYQPCLSITWSAGASKVRIRGTRALVRSSVGKCWSGPKGTGNPQGVAMIGQTQQRAKGR